MDHYLIFKALHITFVVTWFAGLFYLPRLFIYFVEAQERNISERKALQDQFLIMQRRLWYGITWPSCLMAISFGSLMLSQWIPLAQNPWLCVKLCLVFLLFCYHLSLGKIYKQLRNYKISYSSIQLRVWNEVSSLFLISIVFLAILKNILHMGYGLIGLVGLIIILISAIKIYKKIRLKKERIIS